MNTPERQEWSTLAPPVYAQPRRVEVAYRLEMPGVTGARVTCFGLDGDVLVSVWDVSLSAASTEAFAQAAEQAVARGIDLTTVTYESVDYLPEEVLS